MNDEQLIKYIKGELSPEERRQLLDWFDANPANKEYYRQLRKVWDLTLLTGEYEKKPEHDLVYEQILKQTDCRNFLIPQKRAVLWNVLRYASIILLTFGVTWYAMYQPQKANQSIAYHTIEVPTGQRVKINLSDSSVVWLNAGTKFTYPDHFSESERIVILDGEARFDVKTNKQKPFLVKTATHSVQVLGTKFDVYAYERGAKMEVTLFNGSVLLEPINNKQNQLILEPGQQAIFDKSQLNMEIRSRDLIEVDSWINGYHSFHQTPFRDVVERLSHYYDKKILVHNPSILDYECTGKFRHDEKLEQILNVIKMSKPFKYKESNHEIIIY